MCSTTAQLFTIKAGAPSIFLSVTKLRVRWWLTVFCHSSRCSKPLAKPLKSTCGLWAHLRQVHSLQDPCAEAGAAGPVAAAEGGGQVHVQGAAFGEVVPLGAQPALGQSMHNTFVIVLHTAAAYSLPSSRSAQPALGGPCACVAPLPWVVSVLKEEVVAIAGVDTPEGGSCSFWGRRSCLQLPVFSPAASFIPSALLRPVAFCAQPHVEPFPCSPAASCSLPAAATALPLLVAADCVGGSHGIRQSKVQVFGEVGCHGAACTGLCWREPWDQELKDKGAWGGRVSGSSMHWERAEAPNDAEYHAQVLKHGAPMKKCTSSKTLQTSLPVTAYL
eukprot:1021058-Pelagomonas_calceolata.AAC.1